MIRSIIAAVLAACAVAAPVLADSADPNGTAAPPRAPGRLAVDPMPSGSSYPGPAVETWLGARFPPPAPPAEPGLSARPGRPALGAAAILMAVADAGADAEHEFQQCMDALGGSDFVEALGICFCRDLGEDWSGCQAGGY